MPREVIIAGNWKMHKSRKEGENFLSQCSAEISDSQHTIYLAVPFPLIYPLSRHVAETGISIGAQNMHDAKSGAYTGEVSAEMLLDAGAEFVILGHSERRHLFGEDNAFINRKVRCALECGLRPILCVGETQSQREAGQTETVIEQQLSHCLKDVSPEQMQRIAIAYEPVWAIGTGLTAAPEQAQEIHAFCRSSIAKHCGGNVSETVSILYGGSVKPDNTGRLMAEVDIDGVLVGGASLDPQAFAQIVNYQTMKG